MPAFIDLTGRRFSRLTVIKRNGVYVTGGAQWLCECICGVQKTVASASLLQGYTTSCGCYHREVMSKLSRKGPGESGFNLVIGAYKRQATPRGHIWGLSDDDARKLFESDCAYCGTPPENVSSGHTAISAYLYNGIDRVDNAKGYITGNVVSCCRRCNRAKDNMNVNDFYDWIARIHTRRPE